jgi:hypothetical protein
MANVIYDKYKEAVLTSATDSSLTAGSVKVTLVDSGTTEFRSTDEFYSDLSNTDLGILETADLTNVTCINGVLDADDVLFTDVANTSIDAEALLLWIDTADANTSRLVAWMDTNINGLPITPDGSNVDIIWSSSGIFKL